MQGRAFGCSAMGFLTRSWFPLLSRGTSSCFSSPILAENRKSLFFLFVLGAVLGRSFGHCLHFKPGKRRHERDPGRATITRFHVAIKASSPRTVLGNGLVQQRSPGLDGRQALPQFLRLPHQIHPTGWAPMGARRTRYRTRAATTATNILTRGRR